MFCLNVLPIVVPTARRSEGTVLAAAPKASIPRRSLPPFPRFPGFPGGCWEGPKSQPGKRGKMELLVTEKQARGTGPSNPNMEGWGFGVQKFRFSTLSTISRVFKIDFGTRFLGPVFGVQELHFSTLSTLSMLFGVHV